LPKEKTSTYNGKKKSEIHHASMIAEKAATTTLPFPFDPHICTLRGYETSQDWMQHDTGRSFDPFETKEESELD
jgi:hypothetical protein